MPKQQSNGKLLIYLLAYGILCKSYLFGHLTILERLDEAFVNNNYEQTSIIIKDEIESKLYQQLLLVKEL